MPHQPLPWTKLLPWLAALSVSFQIASAQQAGDDHLAALAAALTTLQSATPESCDATSEQRQQALYTAERVAHREVIAVLEERINQSKPEAPSKRITDAIDTLQALSTGLNRAWPAEARLHLEMVDLGPAFAVQIDLRGHSSFVLFGVPESKENPTSRWQQVGSGGYIEDDRVTQAWLTLLRLPPTPSGAARLLVAHYTSGCAGASAVDYTIHTWSSRSWDLQQLNQKGALGTDNNAPGFPQIGRLGLQGTRLTLPYCSWTALDWWDNPNLCFADTYDLAGEEPRFLHSRVNRPDLLPIARALGYAERHDLPAVRAWTGSDLIARRIIHGAPPRIPDAGLPIRRLSATRERVDFGGGHGYIVERRAGHWIVRSIF